MLRFRSKINGKWAYSAAYFSECGDYRYCLYRRWSTWVNNCNFIMLNPSTADENKNDPTVERCERYARKWGYSSLIVTNIFALRSTDPNNLYRASDPIGPDNDEEIVSNALCADLVVCAWGNHGAYMDRGSEVIHMLKANGIKPKCLRTTKQNQPSHPLYLPKDLMAVSYAE